MALIQRTLADNLHDSLVEKLRDVYDQRIDNRWVNFDAEGRLSIHERPLEFLEIVWEMLVRLFTCKYERIEREICLLTGHVNDYLVHERNGDRLAEFQRDFSPIIVDLCRCAHKLARVGKIHRDVVSMHIPAKWKMEQLITPYAHAGLPRQYKFHGLLSFGNEMKGAKVRFQIEGRGEEELTGITHLERHEIEPQGTLHFDVKATGTPIFLRADLIAEHNLLVKKSARIEIQRQGALSARMESVPGQEAVSFLNASEHSIFISDFRVGGEPAEVGQLSIAPGQTGSFGSHVHDREGSDIESISFHTICSQRIPLKIGCNQARYFIKINQDGNLVMNTTPLMVDHQRDKPTTPNLAAPPPSQIKLQSRTDVYDYTNNYEPYVLVVLQANNGKQERVFVPQGETLQRSYDALQQRFGVDWNGDLVSFIHYPKPPLYQPVPHFSSKGVTVI